MHYYRKAMEYLFKYGRGKRFFFIAGLLLLPCALLALFYPLSECFGWFFRYGEYESADWASFWVKTFAHSAPALVSLVVSAVLFVLAAAYITALITRHIRVGEFVPPNVFYSINENFFPALSLTFFLGILVLFGHTVFTLFMFMWTRTLTAPFAVALSVIFFLGIAVGIVYLLANTILWLPTMSFSGLYVFKALTAAFNKARNIQNRLFFPLLAGLLTLFAVALGSYFTRKVWYVRWILDTLNYLWATVSYLTFAIITYCDVEAITREDLTKIYFGR